MSKLKVIKDFTKLPGELQKEILEKYPDGYDNALILFTDKDGKYAHALPYETEEKYYLLRMPVSKPTKELEEDFDEDNDTEDDDFNDLDTIHIGSNKDKDDDDSYD